MIPVREQVSAAILAALQNIAGVAVERDRADDVAVSECPLLVLLAGGHEATERNAGETNYTMQVMVEGWATAAADNGLAAAVNNLHAETVKMLFGLSGQAGIEAIRETGMDDPIIFREGQERPVVVFQMNFEADFNTQEGDPFQVA